MSHDPLPSSARRFTMASVLLLTLVGVAVGNPSRAEDTRLRRSQGAPQVIAECMVELAITRGECEVGTFTGTYPPALAQEADLAPAREAVRALRARSGRWVTPSGAQSTPSSEVCAVLPGRAPVCAASTADAWRLVQRTRA